MGEAGIYTHPCDGGTSSCGMSSWSKQPYCPSVPCLFSLYCTASLCSTAPVPHATTRHPLSCFDTAPIPASSSGLGILREQVQVGGRAMSGPHAVEAKPLGMSRALHAPSVLCKEPHHKASPTLTHQAGEEDVYRGRRGIRETCTLADAYECELLPEEMGFSPAWVWSNSKIERDLEPRDRIEWLWLSVPGWMDPVELWVLPVSRREGSWPPPLQAHSRRRQASPPALSGCPRLGLGTSHLVSHLEKARPAPLPAPCLSWPS